MNKILVLTLGVLLSLSVTSCYVPVDKSGKTTSTYPKPPTESQKASDNYIALAFKYINF
ncbi:MAG: hypothetical protein HRU38_12670, partial [Saccharospirillaceae bacterium]|nr:hypothetical protein [Saccharospirillaceae bacterium]